jgi:RNA polymerase sigma-70 factor (ECF subfamily)
VSDRHETTSPRDLARLLRSRPRFCALPTDAVTHFATRLAARIDDARAAWPTVRVDLTGVVAAIDERLPERDLEAALDGLHVSDLFLTVAIAGGDTRAIRAFDRRLLPEVDAYVARTNSAPAFADEVKQVLRERLLLRRGAEPARIASYRGRGPLGAWLRVAAIRVAHELVRDRGGEVSLDESDGVLTSANPDPELAYLKGRYASEFRHAFQTVLASLPAKERTILRLYFFEAMTVTEIGNVYHVHASTITRWLARSRQRILDETRRQLHLRLGAGTRDLESLLALVQSRLDVSICRFLGDAPSDRR